MGSSLSSNPCLCICVSVCLSECMCVYVCVRVCLYLCHIKNTLMKVVYMCMHHIRCKNGQMVDDNYNNRTVSQMSFDTTQNLNDSFVITLSSQLLNQSINHSLNQTMLTHFIHKPCQRECELSMTSHVIASHDNENGARHWQ